MLAGSQLKAALWNKHRPVPSRWVSLALLNVPIDTFTESLPSDLLGAFYDAKSVQYTNRKALVTRQLR